MSTLEKIEKNDIFFSIFISRLIDAKTHIITLFLHCNNCVTKIFYWENEKKKLLAQLKSHIESSQFTYSTYGLYYIIVDMLEYRKMNMNCLNIHDGFKERLHSINHIHVCNRLNTTIHAQQLVFNIN